MKCLDPCITFWALLLSVCFVFVIVSEGSNFVVGTSPTQQEQYQPEPSHRHKYHNDNDHKYRPHHKYENHQDDKDNDKDGNPYKPHHSDHHKDDNDDKDHHNDNNHQQYSNKHQPHHGDGKHQNDKDDNQYQHQKYNHHSDGRFHGYHHGFDGNWRAWYEKVYKLNTSAFGSAEHVASLDWKEKYFQDKKHIRVADLGRLVGGPEAWVQNGRHLVFSLVDYDDPFSALRIPEQGAGYIALPTFLNTDNVLQVRVSAPRGTAGVAMNAIDFFSQDLSQIPYQLSLRYPGDPYAYNVFQSSLFADWKSPVLDASFNPYTQIYGKPSAVFTFYFDSDNTVHALINGQRINPYQYSEFKVSNINLIGVFQYGVGALDVDSVIVYPKTYLNLLNLK